MLIFNSFKLLPDDYDIPPTVFSILNSAVNFENQNPKKISELAKYGRSTFFDFDYPLDSSIERESFECMILNNFMMRRIGYETVTAFKLALNVKLNEIMPNYNRLFKALSNWEIFEDGEITTRNLSDSSNTITESANTLNNTTNVTNTSDRRYSNTPENALTDVRDGTYVSEYNFDTDTGTNTASSTNSSNGSNSYSQNTIETIKRTPADKMNNFIQFTKEKQNIYTMIFKDLDSLFYQLI